MPAVGDAPTDRRAVRAVVAVVPASGRDPRARSLGGRVRATLSEATDHRKGAAPALARTSGVGAWLGRRFTRRMRLLQVFLGAAGPDRFGALFALSVTFPRDPLRRERKRPDP
jgi:hypothetical protein